MGLFTKKQELSEKSALEAGESSRDGARRFGFGRSKAASVQEQLPTPTTPWTPEGTSAQQSTATSALTSRRNSFTSVRSSVLKELKYEAMVNHLFQQQCSKSKEGHMCSLEKSLTIVGRLWLNDASGDIEGVLLRKSRGVYTTCPPTLADSALAEYCSRLNLQVCFPQMLQDLRSHHKTGCLDSQFSRHPNLH